MENFAAVGSTVGDRYVLVSRRRDGGDRGRADEWDAVDTRLHRPVVVSWVSAAGSGGARGDGDTSVTPAPFPPEGRVVLDGGVHDDLPFVILEAPRGPDDVDAVRPPVLATAAHDPAFDDTMVVAPVAAGADAWGSDTSNDLRTDAAVTEPIPAVVSTSGFDDLTRPATGSAGSDADPTRVFAGGLAPESDAPRRSRRARRGLVGVGLLAVLVLVAVVGLGLVARTANRPAAERSTDESPTNVVAPTATAATTPSSTVVSAGPSPAPTRGVTTTAPSDATTDPPIVEPTTEPPSAPVTVPPIEVTVPPTTAPIVTTPVTTQAPPVTEAPTTVLPVASGPVDPAPGL